MELRHARYFVAVAEELNFRRAAELLHLAQPSLSTQIRLLKEDVGADLAVTILPEQFSRLVTAGVCFIPLARPTPGYRYCAARLRNNRNPALAHFIQIACEVS